MLSIYIYTKFEPVTLIILFNFRDGVSLSILNELKECLVGGTLDGSTLKKLREFRLCDGA